MSANPSSYLIRIPAAADGNENVVAIDACLYPPPPEEQADGTDFDTGFPRTFVQAESRYFVLVVVIVVLSVETVVFV